MAVSCARKKNTVLVSGTLLPNVLETVRTYAGYYGTTILTIGSKDGQTSLEDLKAALENDDVAGVLVPSVNRFGIVEDLEGFADAVHAKKAILIQYCDPSALAVLKSPAEWGADVAVGDGQPLGIPICYGGPYVGFMACRKDYMRKLPGRIVGQTADSEGRRAFVLTLQAREQHIRREKATSNICSNESLMALVVTVYLSRMGPEGMKKVNEQSCAGAHYLYEELLKTGKFEPVFDKPFLKEFVLKPLVDVEALQKKLYDGGFFAALQTEEGYVSFCVTEKKTRQEIDSMVALIKEVQL